MPIPTVDWQTETHITIATYRLDGPRADSVKISLFKIWSQKNSIWSQYIIALVQGRLGPSKGHILWRQRAHQHLTGLEILSFTFSSRHITIKYSETSILWPHDLAHMLQGHICMHLSKFLNLSMQGFYKPLWRALSIRRITLWKKVVGVALFLYTWHKIWSIRWQVSFLFKSSTSREYNI